MVQVTYQLATEPETFATAKQLILDYSASLELDLSFQHFDDELKRLAIEYAAPHGALILARVDGKPAGVIAVHQFADSIAEMKRLYVNPAYRQLGIGHQLVMRLLKVAKQLGYQAIRLDTLPTMKGAQKLYASVGFKPIEAYRFNPVAGTVFLECQL
ncbi:GNAT family N-acetyltransferase [Secundilactobacillus similis]|uniref:Acetyltransferase n=1 Tax=Secundilactobacillus similis DSM 23365 = JCM 2765 TaxID=1423804 RepID=A0A0R2ERH8_9LACO|nr:GNAT family N-acetyltransferase [Secundilactobacillus similis]KRN18978.1 acetyltransferase [Secundilactobacillus similis DSM 23365 = JCM 2765]